MIMNGTVYRVESRREGTRIVLVVREFKVTKVTPKGFQIDWYGHSKFIRSAAKKKFAHSSVTEALDAFRRRKKRQLEICRARFEEATLLANLGAIATPSSIEHTFITTLDNPVIIRS